MKPAFLAYLQDVTIKSPDFNIYLLSCSYQYCLYLFLGRGSSIVKEQQFKLANLKQLM